MENAQLGIILIAAFIGGLLISARTRKRRGERTKGPLYRKRDKKRK